MKNKTNFFKEITKEFDLFFAIILGALCSFALSYCDSINIIHKLGLTERWSKLMVSGAWYALYGVVACFVVALLVNMFRKKVTMLDYFLVSASALGLTSLCLELFGNKQPKMLVLWGVLLGVCLVTWVFRFLFVKEEGFGIIGQKKYFSTIAAKYNFVLLGIIGIAFGFSLAIIANLIGWNGMIAKIIPAWANLTQPARYGLVAGVFGAICAFIVLYTIISNHRSKVSVLDALLIVAQIAVLTGGIYFGKDLPKVSRHLFLLWLIANASLLLVVMVRSIFVNADYELPEKLERTSAYYYGFAKKSSMLFVSSLGAVLAMCFIYMDRVGLKRLFAFPRIKVVTIVAIIMVACWILLMIYSLCRKQLKEHKIVLMDNLLFVATSAGLAMILDFFIEFSILKLVLWVIAFVTVLCFDAIRIVHYQTVKETDSILYKSYVEVVDCNYIYKSVPIVMEHDEDEKPNIIYVEKPVEEETVAVVEEVQKAQVEETKKVIVYQYNKSFRAKVSLAKHTTRDYYNELKNYLLSYKLHSRISWNFDSFNSGRKKVAKLNIRGKTLVMYIALDPKEFENTKYFFKDASDSKKYVDTPMVVKVKSDRGLKYAYELIDILMARLNLVKKEMEKQDYKEPVRSFAKLLEMQLIKKIGVERTGDAFNFSNVPAEEVVDTDEDDDDDEKEGLGLQVRYNKSFLAKVSLATDEARGNYNTIKNKLMTYKVRSRISWNFDSFNAGRTKIAKLNIRGKTLVLYLALDPKEFENTKYFFKDVSESKKYAETPMLLKLRSPRSLKYAAELIDQCMMRHEVGVKKVVQQEDYLVEKKTLEALVQEGLVKDNQK